MTDQIERQADATPAPTKKRRRIFLWFFLVIQTLFVVMLITGVNAVNNGPGDCGTLDPASCKDAHAAGATIGVGLLITLWMATDVILGFTYLVYRLASRTGRRSDG